MNRRIIDLSIALYDGIRGKAASDRSQGARRRGGTGITVCVHLIYPGTGKREGEMGWARLTGFYPKPIFMLYRQQQIM